LQLSPDLGGSCHQCGKQVSPKALQHELAMTMTIHNVDPDTGQPALEFPQTRSAVEDDDPVQIIGKTYGHFEIVDPLGRGGMGQVYRALDKSLQRYVAVKLLRSGIGSTRATGSSEAEIDSLLQEAVSQARVTHPNIVTIYYVGKQDGHPFLAMELINGSPLSKLIAAGDLTFSQISPIALQIARALNFSYELDIIHGDIKPSNVLVQTNGLTKLSDFGMARRASAVDAGKLGGTPNYIAPELLLGEKPTRQSDMYALGVTFYEMTFGKLPVLLSGQTIPQWISSHETANVRFPNPWPEDYPERWQAVLRKLLAKDPADRYESYDQLIDDLEAIKPQSRIIAKRAPRFIAAGIDWLTIFLLIAPIELAIQLGQFGRLFGGNRGLEFLVRLTDLIPMAVYTLILFIWRQSLGRSLMQVRVVNAHGLIPTQKTMLSRSVLRMIIPWFACILLLMRPADFAWTEIITTTVFVLALAFWLLDVMFMLILDQGRSLHDLIFGTRVVVDTDR
jgi:uncharacterized RDD family membrane protein YckC